MIRQVFCQTIQIGVACRSALSSSPPPNQSRWNRAIWWVCTGQANVPSRLTTAMTVAPEWLARQNVLQGRFMLLHPRAASSWDRATLWPTWVLLFVECSRSSSHSHHFQQPVSDRALARMTRIKAVPKYLRNATDGLGLSRYHLYRHWWHRRFSLWQPLLPPVTTK